jgi:hypothetical protein
MAPVTTVLAVAASLALYIRSTSVVDGPSPLDDVRTKGVDYALDLTREGDGADVEAGYRDGDRWKVLVTCPTGRDTHLDVVVYDNLEPSFPLPALERLPCGNGIPLPGAFRLTGSQEMSVCLVWDEDKPLDRDMLRVTEMEKLPHRVCKTIRPAP